jgi:hypothetical protein
VGKLKGGGGDGHDRLNAIILPVPLYWFETWSRLSREEHRLKVFENRVLRRVLGLKMEITA